VQEIADCFAWKFIFQLCLRSMTLPPPLGRCVASVVPGTLSTAICSGLPVGRGPAHPLVMGTKSRETIYGGSVRAAAERATEARKEADRLACEAWNKRMLGFQGPAQPIARPGRRDQRRVWLSRSEMFRPQHASDCRARYRAATEDDASP
jgi:hypothetical protein